MDNKCEPMTMTFVADTPYDEAVRLINVLQRQCEVSDTQKEAVLAACEFIIARNRKGE